eukprot:9504015-Pyramimonas_sp.AAC.3
MAKPYDWMPVPLIVSSVRLYLAPDLAPDAHVASADSCRSSSRSASKSGKFESRLKSRLRLSEPRFRAFSVYVSAPEDTAPVVFTRWCFSTMGNAPRVMCFGPRTP